MSFSVIGGEGGGVVNALSHCSLFLESKRILLMLICGATTRRKLAPSRQRTMWILNYSFYCSNSYTKFHILYILKELHHLYEGWRHYCTVSEGRSDSNILAGGCDVVFRAKYLKPVPYISVRRYERALQPRLKVAQ